MNYFNFNNYELIKHKIALPDNDIFIADHLGGFTKELSNPLFESLVEHNFLKTVNLQYVVNQALKKRYESINIKFSAKLQNSINFTKHKNYTIHPELNYKNFVCSFNGSAHVSRKLLASILHRFNWFDAKYCSKNFSYTVNTLDGHISDYVADHNQFYRKFFIADNSDAFFNTIYSFGHVRFDHANNIYNLENKLTESFLHIVSETMATSYYPFVTEKFLYSVVTRGLFLAYAQPGWHDHVEKYYGFRRYTKLFDYRFDSVQNPVERLVELVSMISKFSNLSSSDWQDLYLLQQDEIEYNYDHYFSGDYLTHLKKYE
jgi:hypothetical protein